MGWFWGSGKNGSSKDNRGDPLRDLDPSLRDFLEKESPVKYQTSKPPPSPSSAPEPSPRPDKFANSTSSKFAEPTDAAASSLSTKLPAASLYPDGRYAHLWSTYRSQAEIEGTTRTEQEKLSDVLEGYKERKAMIGRTALENCVLEHMAVSDCFQTGGWGSRLTMCRAENKKFERCYMMQARFLKALGYLSTYDSPPETDEKIQMHADVLYHRMLDQERLIKEAEAAGQPIPEFPPIVASLPSSTPVPSSQASTSSNAAATSPSQHADPTPADFSPKVQAHLAKRLRGLSPAERELEEKAIAMEIAAGQIVAKEVDKLYEEQGKAKRERKARGKETVTDKVSGWFGW